MMTRRAFTGLAVFVLALSAVPAPAARFFEKSTSADRVTLDAITAAPEAWLDRSISIEIRFQAIGNAYDTFFTPFDPRYYVNFSGWAHERALWRVADRERNYPFLYYDKEGRQAGGLSALTPFTPLRIEGSVRSVFHKVPCIEVTRFEILKEPRLDERVIERLGAAETFFAQGRTEMAGAELRAALAKPLPGDAAAAMTTLSGRMKREAGDLAGARTDFQRALQLGGPDANVLAWLGETDLADGRPAEAVKSLETSLTLAPRNAAARVLLVWALGDLKDTAGALREGRKAVELDPESADAHWALARALSGGGDIPGAEESYLRAITLRPGDPDILQELAGLYEAQGRTAEAIRRYEEGLLANPDDADLHYLLAKSLARNGQNDKALAELDRALVLNPDHLMASLEAGFLYVQTGKAEKGEKCLETVVKRAPDRAAAHYFLGKARAELGKTDDAIASFRRAIALEPKSPMFHAELGNVCAEAGRWNEALAAFEAARKLDPKNERLAARIEEARLKTGKAAPATKEGTPDPRAEAARKKAEAAEKAKAERAAAIAKFEEGETYFSAGKFAEARVAFTDVQKSGVDLGGRKNRAVKNYLEKIEKALAAPAPPKPEVVKPVAPAPGVETKPDPKVEETRKKAEAQKAKEDAKAAALKAAEEKKALEAKQKADAAQARKDAEAAALKAAEEKKALEAKNKIEAAQARKEAEAAAEAARRDALAKFEAGEKCFQAGQYAEAKTAFEEVQKGGVDLGGRKSRAMKNYLARIEKAQAASTPPTVPATGVKPVTPDPKAEKAAQEKARKEAAAAAHTAALAKLDAGDKLFREGKFAEAKAAFDEVRSGGVELGFRDRRHLKKSIAACEKKLAEAAKASGAPAPDVK